MLFILVTTLKYAIAPEKMNEIIKKQKAVKELLCELYTSRTFKMFIHYLFNTLHESLTNSGNLAPAETSKLKKYFSNEYFTTPMLDPWVDLQVNQEECIELMKEALEMMTIKRYLRTEGQNQDAKIVCAPPGKPLDKGEESICALILYFDNREPAVYMYRDVPVA